MTTKVKSWLTHHWLTLIGLVPKTRFSSKVMPTNNTNYSCHINCKTYLSNYWVHIMPLVITSLGADTQTHTHHRQDRNQARATHSWFRGL